MYRSDVKYDYNDSVLDLEGLKRNGQDIMETIRIRRVKVDNILVSGEWAAIHAWNVASTKEGKETVFDNMSFYHFAEDNGGLKVDMCWIKETPPIE